METEGDTKEDASQQVEGPREDGRDGTVTRENAREEARTEMGREKGMEKARVEGDSR